MDMKQRGDSTDRSRRAFLELAGSTALAAGGVLLTQAGRAYPREVRKKIRMGVVGGNFGATFWWHEHPNCEVTGVTDLRPERRDRLQKRYHCDNVYDSLEIMIREAKNIDAVAVFSGAVDHAKHVKMCMDRGWHVVSAVPACFSLEEAAMIKEVKEKTALKYMMAESSYYRQECIFARNMFDAGEFGELFYAEAEYYHDRGSLKNLAENPNTRFFTPNGKHSWRWGFPPMHYPTHSLSFLTGVTKERIVKVSCLGWGGTRSELKNHPFLADNAYGNPFWNETSMMLTNRGHACRCNVFWICVAGGERARWFGDRATFYMPDGGLNETVIRVRTKGTNKVAVPEYWKSDMLPEPMRHASGHGGSAVFISAEFINAILEDREPAIDLYESLAMTVPGIIAHQSAMKQGEQLEVPQFDSA